jgi:hypothetical protein
MKLTLGEITPDLVRTLSDEREEKKLSALARAEVMDLADEFHASKQFALEMQVRCQIRAVKMYQLYNYTKEDLCHVFDVPKTTINSWLKSPLIVL